jgi:hypothetical protein
MPNERTLRILIGIAVPAVTTVAAALLLWNLTFAKPGRGSADTDFCHSNWDCPGSAVCKQLKLADGRLGRMCRVRGTGREGDFCRSPPRDSHESCIEALRCNYGFCGRPCDPFDPETCPTGTRCRDSGEGPSCVPSCRGVTCPADTECAWIDADFAICAESTGEHCDVHPCKPGMLCLARYRQIPQHPTVETRCVVACSETAPCTAGQFCDDGECAMPCRLGGNDCPAGMTCSEAVTPRKEGRCWPEQRARTTSESQ